MTVEILRANIERSLDVHGRLLSACLPAMTKAAEALVSAYRAGRKAIFFGNGGSAADAQHLACELTVKLHAQRPSLAALALTTNSSVLTAAGNDFGFEQIFSRQVESLVSPGDILVALSTSGVSPNIIRALDAPAARAAYRVAFTGETGGDLLSRVDLLINVPSRNAQHIQEAHITIGHIACALIEQMRVGRAAH